LSNSNVSDGGGNRDVNPGFVSWIDPSVSGWQATTGGDYRLTDGSLAINAGNNSQYPASADDSIFSGITLSQAAKAAINAALGTDLGGNSRKVGVIDLGAYENTGGIGPALITLTINDEGTGAFSQETFIIYKTPAVGQSGKQTLTLTGGYSSPVWFVDGVEKGTDDSITLKAVDYVAGNHSLTLMVKKDSSYWSKELTFTVAD
jgi:hypothetical protein